jgi:hypothetical protein
LLFAEDTMWKSSVALFGCAAVACSAGERGTPRGSAPSPSPSSSGGAYTALTKFEVRGDLGEGNVLLAPIRYQSLALVPIAASGETSDEDYLVLDEAMQKGLVSIDEQGPVNSLTLANRSELPVFIMSGEVVIGGKQDRIIGKNTIVTAAATETIPVFCVEHGRWGGSQSGFSTAGVLAHSSLREKANFDDQSTVWREVAAKNEKRNTSNATDTYRHSAAQQTGTALAAWEAHFDAALARLPAMAKARLVGYAVAVNGEVVAVDMFENPRLFAKLDRKLRRSYYAEAVDVAANSDARVPDAAAIRAFVARADAAPAQQVHASSAADTVNNVAEDSASTQVMSKKARPASGKARPIYKSVQRRTK